MMGMLATPEALRHTLQLIEPAIADFVPPNSPFDPAGSWSHVYRISMLGNSAARGPGGQLKIRRSPQADGSVLEVEQQWTMGKQYASWAKASIECAADRLSMPRRWMVETWTCRPDRQEETGSRLKFSAQPAGQEIRFSGVRKPPLTVGGQWTLDWALLDALQRLPKDSGNLSFNMIEDYDLLRPRQQLSSTGRLAVKLAGKERELFGFCQIGTGTLPTHYWLDAQHRLLFVIHYYRVYVLQTNDSGGEK